jgi:hypothetical protein
MANRDNDNSPSYNDILETLRYAKETQAQFDAAHTLFIEQGKRINGIHATQAAQAEMLEKLANFDIEGVRNLSKLVLGDSQLRIVGLVTLHDQMNEVQESIRTLTFIIAAMASLLIIMIAILVWVSVFG